MGQLSALKGLRRTSTETGSTRVVCLNRRYNARVPTGIYCCEIPGSNGNLCVGAYNLGDGKQIEFFKPQNGHQIMNILYHRYRN